MIQLTRINHATLVLNSDLIEHIEVTPDTVISLINGQKFMVLESAEEVINKVIEFRRAVSDQMLPCSLLNNRVQAHQNHCQDQETEPEETD